MRFSARHTRHRLVLGLAAWLAATAAVRAQTYTWTGATDTNFNAPTNYTAGLSFPTSGTLRLTSGTAIPNAPTLTASTTAAAIVFGQGSAFAFGSSDPAAVLTLTGPIPLSKAANVTGTIGTNFVLGGSGTQTFSLPDTTLLTGTISGGNAGDILWFNGNPSAGAGTEPRPSFPHAGNTFTSTVRFGGSQHSNGAVQLVTTNVASLGTTGQPSSLGSAGTIVLRNSNYFFLSTTAPTQSSDKSLVLEWTNGGTLTGGVNFGLNGGAVGFNGSFVGNYGTRPALNLSGSITAAPVVGWSGTAPLQSNFYTGQSGTLSGVISDSPNHVLSVWSHGAVLSNPNNTFSGSFLLGSGLFSGTYSTTALGMIGSPSPIGSGTTIYLLSATRLRYSGPGETSDKTFNFYRNGGSSNYAVIDASGSGELVLSNTTPIAGLVDMGFNLNGTGRGTLASNLASTFTGINKGDSGTWTLTGSNAVVSINVYDGPLIFARRVALLASDTNWVKSKVMTMYGSTASPVLGMAVGGTNGFSNADVTTLITALGSGDATSGGMRSRGSWGFDTTNTGSTFEVADTIGNTSGGSGNSTGGNLGVVKLGSGTLRLSGTNTYAFGTRVDGGVLTVTNTAALGSGAGFLSFTGGTLDLAGLTLDRPGGMTATAGGLTNGVISGTGSLVKTGGGTFRIDATANTFTGSTSIQEGVIEAVALAASGVASSLGTGTGANATINLGNAATSGTFRYVGGTSGTMSRTLNLSGSTGGGGIEASGDGPLVVTSAVTVANGSKTLTLGGTGTAANAMGVIGEPTTGDLSVIKDGPGLWRLTGVSTFEGGLTVKNGTVVATANSGGSTDAGAFGKSQSVTVGDATAGAAGTAALLLAAGVNSSKQIIVPATIGGSQAVVLGSQGTSGTSASFDNEVRLSRAVTLMAATSGTTTFGNFWYDSSGTASPTVSVTIGSSGNLGTVLLKNNLTTTGSVGVRFGTLNVDDSKTLTAAGIVGIDSGAKLAGVGTVAATLGGAGLVAPGNSPGVLTANAVDPTAGLDFNFEFTGTAPTYVTGTASVNDVLRLTGSSAFTTLLSSSNAISVYLDVGTLALNDTFRGGFFTDQATSFASSIAAATYTYWVSGSGAGQTTYENKTYVPFASAYPSLAMDATTVVDTAEFSVGSPVTGQVTQFTVVVPEPGSLALAALGLGLTGWAVRRRRPLPRPPYRLDVGASDFPELPGKTISLGFLSEDPPNSPAGSSL